MSIFIKLVHFITKINKWLAYITLVVMMILVFIFSISRTLGKPILGDVELVQFGMVLLIVGSLSYTQASNSHISIGIVVDKFTLKAQLIVDIIANLLILIFSILVAWAFLTKLNFAQTSSLLSINFYFFKILLAIGFLGWGMEALSNTFNSVNKLQLKGGDDIVR